MSGDTTGSVLGASTVASSGLAALAATGDVNVHLFLSLGISILLVSIFMSCLPFIIRKLRSNKSVLQ